jgi:hypothetical protein
VGLEISEVGVKIQSPKSPTNVEDWIELKRFTSIALDDILSVLNGNIGFTDNCLTTLVSVTIGTANKDVEVRHNLGFTPNGYIVAGLTKNMVIFDGTQAATKTTLYVQGSASGVARLLVF